MTVDEVKKRVIAIAKVSEESETAHSMEDKLFQDVLWSIASHTCEDPLMCAQEALVSLETEFPRWCA